MEEQWQSIPSYPLYEASSLGRIRRAERYIRSKAVEALKPSLNVRGYLFVSIANSGKKTSKCVHALVCEAFHGQRPTERHEVAHGDGVKTNNLASNLRWATRKENLADRVRHGTMPTGDRSGSRIHIARRPRGDGHGGAKLSSVQVLAIRESTERQIDLAAHYGVSQQQISDIKRRRVWTHI